MVVFSGTNLSPPLSVPIWTTFVSAANAGELTVVRATPAATAAARHILTARAVVVPIYDGCQFFV